MRYWLVMPAAGAGARFGGAKQFASLSQRTVLELALQPFVDDAQCLGAAIALAPNEPRRSELALRVPAHFELIDGGLTRAHSVINALAALAARAAPEDWVLVHDAARPCLSAADLARLLAGAVAGSQGALLAIPVADTVKQALPAVPDEPARCERAALERARALGRTPTDEAQAMEWQGVSAQLIEAREANIKVTSPADLLLARAILQAREDH